MMSIRVNTPDELTAYRQRLQSQRDPDRICVAICTGTGCRANCGLDVAEAFREAFAEHGLQDKVDVRLTGCLGFCEEGPIVNIRPQGLFYTRVKPKDAAEITAKTLVGGEDVTRLFAKHPDSGEPLRTKDDIPFFKHQSPEIFGANFEIDPESICDYVHQGGYDAASKALKMTPESIIEQITRSGLRGRGGAGFPTGVKWASCRKATGETKFVICNADEGDPGAYANRSLLEGNPHSVIEGMIIGAYAIGASEGYIYVRTEYPLAVALMKQAVSDARETGLLGENILGTGFAFDIKINRGGGAFVCGESTALMASIEGRVGEPRAKHIHTVERGLWDKPSTLNNVETWANIPHIINRGAEWFTSIGTGDVSENAWGGSKGTKIFSLVGKVNNTGLVEVPMGTTLREVIFEIGGGIPKGKKFKGVQTGGPSGGILAERHLDIPIDYDQLVEVGSMMGSGGMIVMDEDNCMVDFARFFLSFLEDESCGKCTPCREGVTQMRQLLEDIGSGKGTMATLDALGELAGVVRDASLCQLGSTAPNPVLTTMEYFREEYEAHIKEGRCPAGVCKALVHYNIVADDCTGCGLCKKACPTGAVSGEKKEPHSIDDEKCTKCGICYDACNVGAVVHV
jgi:NADH:ubiquinone oxidoreductase subunit F (NADH-binding)/(2Fe-2S) ferredoxin/Pyruvate/2-oxoacid:ferredoxin oxidoreductase delta subunit